MFRGNGESIWESEAFSSSEINNNFPIQSKSAKQIIYHKHAIQELERDAFMYFLLIF